jgi:iron-sulfur cluster repair protein YtfE (RIC family)
MTQDPIDRLLAEHADLMARLEPLRRAVRALSEDAPGAVDAALPVLRTAAHLLNNDLIAHARREDEVFFPAVEAVMGESFGPTTVMRSEHVEIHAGAQQFRSTLHELQEVQHPAIVAGGARLAEGIRAGATAADLLATARGLLELIDDHFAKEEQVLFPMSRQLLDESQLRGVAEKMELLDAG